MDYLVDKTIKNLSPEELECLMFLIEQEGVLEGEHETLGIKNVMEGLEYDRECVGIEEWINEPYFSGKLPDSLYPILKKDLVDLFQGDYQEAILGGCVDKNAFIQKSNGDLVRLRDLSISDPSTVLSGDSIKSEWRPVLNKWDSGIKNVCKITLASGQDLILTQDHKVRTSDGWIEAINLLGKFVYVPRNIKTIPDCDVPIEHASIVGYMLGDGSTTDTQGRFKDGRKETCDDLCGILKIAGFESHVVRIDSENCWELRVNDFKKSGFKDFCYEYSFLNINCKSTLITSKILRSNDQVIAACLNKIFSCEGTIVVNGNTVPKIQLGLANRDLLTQIQLVLMRLGIRSSIKPVKSFHKKQRKFYYWNHLVISSKNQILKFFEIIGVLVSKESECSQLIDYCHSIKSNTNVDVIPLTYKEMGELIRRYGVVISRENKRFRKYQIDTCPSAKKDWDCNLSFDGIRDFCDSFDGTALSKYLRNKYLDGNVRYERVVKVEIVNDTDTADIHVDGEHCFYANGLLVHNSIGWGKSTFANVAVIRMIYEVSCLKNPQRSYGLEENSSIIFASLSVNIRNAQQVVFSGIADKIRSIPYFVKCFQGVHRRGILFPKNIVLAAGSSTNSSVIGLNIFGGIIDEINFMRSASSQRVDFSKGYMDRAESLYAAIIRRMKSRYMRGGKIPGILIQVSSKRSINDFTERRIKEARHDPFVFVREYGLWETKPESYHSRKKFRVLVGNDRIRSKILSDDEKVDIPDDSDIVIIEVPEDFRLDFERDLDGSIRDIAGCSTHTIASFIQNSDKIYEMADERSHPFSAYEYNPLKEEEFLWDMLCSKNAKTGDWEPKINPQAVRHVHIDPSITGDATGFCMAHVSHWTEVVRRRSPGEDDFVKEMVPFFVVDFILRIIPPPGEEIPFSKVRELIYDLSKHGFHIKLVTTDSYQRIAYSQALKEKGYATDLVSVDINMDPYESLKLALYENRIKCYKYDPLFYELRYLEEDKTRRKIDHRPDMSKDAADALAGCIFTLTTRITNVQPIAPTMGVSDEIGNDDIESDGTWVIDNGQVPVGDEFDNGYTDWV
jgi:intein/homing endonuclease